MNKTTSIDTGSLGGRFEVRVVQSGEIEIYTPDGQFEIEARHNNVIKLRCVPIEDSEMTFSAIFVAISSFQPEGSTRTGHQD